MLHPAGSVHDNIHPFSNMPLSPVVMVMLVKRTCLDAEPMTKAQARNSNSDGCACDAPEGCNC